MLPASPNGTYGTGPGASVTDAQGVVYAINDNGQITINGTLDPTTARVDAIGVFNGQVWQKNGDNLWYSKASAAATWANYPASGGNPMPVPGVANNQSITIDGGPAYNQFHDTHGNLWQINAAGQVVIDGRVDTTTARVVAMELVNGKIWQENADGNWYSKLKPSDTWTAAVRVDPATAAQAAAQGWVGGQGGNDPRLGANWSNGQAPGPDGNLSMAAGTMNLGSGKLGGSTLNIASATPSPASPPTINMTRGGDLHLVSNGASVQVNVTGGGQATLHEDAAYPDLRVAVDARSALVLDTRMVFGSLTEHGGAVLLNGDSTFYGSRVLLDAGVAGFGTLNVEPGRGGGSTMEVTGAVGAGVTIAVGSIPHPISNSTLTLDNGLADHGTVTLQDSYLYLKNVGPVDSMSYKDSLLSLYKGGTLVDAVKVAGVADAPGGVSNGVLNFAYSQGAVTVNDGGAGTITGLTLHA